MTFRGTFIDGAPRGPIEIKYPNNMRYYGSFRDNHPIAEGVFTFDMKYMQHGHFEMIPDPVKPTQTAPMEEEDEIVEMKLSDESQPKIVEPKCSPHFITHEITEYDYTRMPQHPIPPPQTDSSNSSICSKISSTSEIEVHLYKLNSPVLIAADDCSEEIENE